MRRAVAASETHVAEAARGALARGNAVDAVVAGVLAAAAQSPGVLLGPLQILAGGVGAGLMGVDGRVRQPGLGAPRPRGFLPGEPIPDAARVGVPALPAALATALAALGTRTLPRAAGYAIDRARALSPERARLLEALCRRGAPALAEDSVAAELMAVAGRGARGLLTADDLALVRPELVRCAESSLDARGMLFVPWGGRGNTDASWTQVVLAGDGRGMLAAACYDAPPDGVAVPPLGLVAPCAASPVLRGERRVLPGQPRPAPAPVTLRARAGILDLALGVAEASDAEGIVRDLAAAAATPAFGREALRAAGGRAVGLVCGRDAVRVLGAA